MERIDPYALFEHCLDQGFSLLCISKSTDIPMHILEKYHNQELLSVCELNELVYLTVFLTQLYHTDPNGSEYSKNLIDGLKIHFGVTEAAISNYLGISPDNLAKALSDAADPYVRITLEKKIMHLFFTFVRDKRHSSY